MCGKIKLKTYSAFLLLCMLSQPASSCNFLRKLLGGNGAVVQVGESSHDAFLLGVGLSPGILQHTVSHSL